MTGNNKFIGAGISTAVAASLCCITPLLALVAGSSSIASIFLWMEPLRPVMISLTILLIGFAWYQKMKHQKADECSCDPPEKQKFIQTKTFLGIITLFTALAIAFPNYAQVFYSHKDKQPVGVTNSAIRQVKLKITGMTCAACEDHIKHEVNKLAGIVKLDVSYTNRNALVTFDTIKTSKQAIEEAVKNSGYLVTEARLK